MKFPKMILFDYGHTLLYEPDYDSLRGEKALFRYVTENKYNLSPEEVNQMAGGLFSEFGKVREINMELHQLQFQKMLYEYLGITLSIPYEEAELVFWDNTSAGALMPGADRMLDTINAMNIRSGVISNIGFSGNALTNRITRLLPNHRFEFMIASSEYGFRKPNRFLFELALRKANLPPDEVWFCGDTVKADIDGASAAGIFPVWYEEYGMYKPWREQEAGHIPDCSHLHIHDWVELIAVLEKLK